VGKYTAADKIEFTGTPLYNIVLKNNGGGTETRTENSPYTVPPGYTVQSFTDKTGAPGTFSCIPSTSYNLVASAAGFCEGAAGVTFSLSKTESGRSYELYKGAGTVTTLTGTGSAATFSGAQTEGIYTARVLASADGYCEAAMSGTHVVNVKPVPTITLVDGSGAATQTVNLGTAISAISYTASNSATFTKTGDFPTGVTESASGSSYSISGTPSATGTFGYSLTAAVNECTSAAAVGTITVNVVATPPGAASTQTWTFGSRTWSDVVRVDPPTCTLVTAVTLSYNDATYVVDNARYFYTYMCLMAAQSALCSGPWHVPDDSDWQILLANTTRANIVSQWGYNGWWEHNRMCTSAAVAGGYAGTSPWQTHSNGTMYYSTNNAFNVRETDRRWAYEVRCVK
jgi:hypothetical protein